MKGFHFYGNLSFLSLWSLHSPVPRLIFNNRFGGLLSYADCCIIFFSSQAYVTCVRSLLSRSMTQLRMFLNAEESGRQTLNSRFSLNGNMCWTFRCSVSDSSVMKHDKLQHIRHRKSAFPRLPVLQIIMCVQIRVFHIFIFILHGLAYAYDCDLFRIVMYFARQ